MKADVKLKHGYLVLPRQSLFLFQELGHDLFGFYIGLIMSAIWHRGNKNFGKIIKTQTMLAFEQGINQATISRKLKELEKHKYFVVRHRNEMLLGFFPLFLRDVASKIHSKDYANLRELYTDMHSINADLQDKYADLQDKRAQNVIQRLNSSFKDNLISYDYDSERFENSLKGGEDHDSE